MGRLDALFVDPARARDRTNLAQLVDYLHNESVSPLAIRRLVQRHPAGADPVFGTPTDAIFLASGFLVFGHLLED